MLRCLFAFLLVACLVFAFPIKYTPVQWMDERKLRHMQKGKGDYVNEKFIG